MIFLSSPWHSFPPEKDGNPDLPYHHHGVLGPDLLLRHVDARARDVELVQILAAPAHGGRLPGRDVDLLERLTCDVS